MSSRILCGDARAMLATLPEKSVHCVVTSPPYWNLRNYQTVPVDWPAVTYAPMPGLPPIEVPAMTCELGQESTPEAYIGHLVLVFREVWRVMDDSATCWINVGDSYATNRNDSDWLGGKGGELAAVKKGWCGGLHLKAKNLIGVPWRLAFALQADGWWLRSDIIWSKPAPMPESVQDRVTRSHEYIFMLAKAESYYYDAHAIAEAVKPETTRHIAKYGGSLNVTHADASRTDAKRLDYFGASGTRNKRSVWTMNTQGFAEAHFATFPAELPTTAIKAGTSERGHCPACNKRWVRIVDRTKADVLSPSFYRLWCGPPQ